MSGPGRDRRTRGRAMAIALLALVPALSVGQPPPASDKADPPAPALAQIALVLPLDSTTYGRAADAVKAGFAAAADAAKAQYSVIAHADGEVAGAFVRAKEGGARVIVGPLVRDDLKTIATAGGEMPWTIALNQLDEGAALPERIVTLTLTLDGDARQIARRIHDDGATAVAIVASDSLLQKRFASAFTGEWILQGGGPPATFRFDRSPDVLALLRRELGKNAPDAIVLAVDGGDAALVKPYVGAIPAYGSSQVNERQPRESLRDLDGLRFIEIPWIADPSSPRFAGMPRRDFSNAALDRLYALGIDAFAVAQAYVGGAPALFDLEGATGRLTLDQGRQILRDGRLMEFRDGQIVPVDGR